jgi:hypothetical protein
VNRRGQTSYTGVGYCVDGWLIDASTATVALTPNGLALSGTGSGDGFRQYVEDVQSFKGRKVAYSIEMNGKRYSSAGVVPEGAFPEGVTWITGVNVPSLFATQLYAVGFGDGAEALTAIVRWFAPVVCGYAKLEEGGVSTPLVREDSAIKLLRCQRRYEILLPSSIDVWHGICLQTWANDNPQQGTFTASVFMRYSVEKRAVPSLDARGTFRVVCSSPAGVTAVLTANAVTLSPARPETAQLNFSGTGAIPSDTTFARIDNAGTDGYIAVTADF